MKKYFLFFIFYIGFQINMVAQTNFNDNLVFYAQEDSLPAVKKYLSLGASPDAMNEDGYSALMFAADNGNYEICSILLEKGANPNLKARYNDAPPALTASIKANYPRVADLILQYNAEVDIKDNYNRTPLYYAVSYGFIECAEVLLYHGANPNLAAREKFPMQVAAYYNDTATASLLVAYGAYIKNPKFDRSLLSIAAERGNKDMIEWLIKKGVDINEIDSNLCSAVSYASRFSDTSTIACLKSKGADLQIKNSFGRSLYDECMLAGVRDNAEYLKKYNTTQKFKIVPAWISFSLLNEFFKNEYRFGFQAGIHEIYTNLAIYVAYAFRPAYSYIWQQKGDNLYWQMREKRQFFHSSLEKRFSFCHSNIPDFGAYIAYQFSISNGKYDGSVLDKPKTKYFHVPRAGIYMRFRNFGISSGYSYYNYDDVLNAPSNVVDIKMTFYFKTLTSKLTRWRL